MIIKGYSHWEKIIQEYEATPANVRKSCFKRKEIYVCQDENLLELNNRQFWQNNQTDAVEYLRRITYHLGK